MKANIINVRFSRVYQYKLKDLEGENINKKTEDAKEKAWMDFESDFYSVLEPVSDNFSITTSIIK